mgnify:CR=1 FL=1
MALLLLEQRGERARPPQGGHHVDESLQPEGKPNRAVGRELTHREVIIPSHCVAEGAAEQEEVQLRGVTL